jgi:hypothetical protein
MNNSPAELLNKIEEGKDMLRADDTYKDMCKEFEVDPDIIDLIPIRFGDIDVSAKTVRGIIILNKKLLLDDNFKNNIHYLLHEISHFLQMTTRKKPTQGANDGEYLENKDEIEAFTYQIEYMDEQYGDEEAEKYIEHLLNHHDVNDREEREEKKKELSERVEKTAQRTEFDSLKPNPNEPRGENPEQLSLKKIDREWEARKKKEQEVDPAIAARYRPSWDIHYNKSEPLLDPTQNKIKFPTKKEIENSRSKINLDFHKLTPEQIKWRKLNDQETNRLLNEESREMHNSRDPNQPPSTQVYFDLNKQLPEQAKAAIISAYDEFRTVAATFKANYEEANELAGVDNSLNYDGTYADCLKRLPDFIVRAARRGIGIFFGDTNGESADARELLKFLETGINIFNITPLNFQGKINQMAAASKQMSNISAAYSKRKKLLQKLPQEAQEASTTYLRKKDVREFLKWLDEYFPNDKEGFFADVVREILDDTRSGSQWTFNIGGLRKFKTFSSIYYQAQSTLKYNLISKIHSNVRDEMRQRLLSEITSRLTDKLDELTLQVNGASSENTSILEKYLFSTFKLDLRGILQLTGNVFKARYGEPLWEEKFLDFKGNFLENLREKIKDKTDKYEAAPGPNGVNINQKIKVFPISINSSIKNVVNKFQEQHMVKGDYVDFKSLSSLSGKDFENLVFKSIYDLIIRCLPNFEKDRNSGDANSYSYPAMAGAGRLIKETGRLSVDNAVNFALSKAPFVPKEFWTHLVKSAFKKFAVKPSATEMITGTDTSSLSGNAILEEISNLVGTNLQDALKLMLDLLQKSGKYNPDSFTNLFINHFKAFTYCISVLHNNIPQLKGDEKMRVLNLAFRNVDTVDKDKEKLNDFALYIHNSAGALPPKDLLKLMSNKNYIQYSSVGISKKILRIGALVRAYGGLAQLLKKHGPVIQSMKESGYISKNFESNIRYVSKIINSGIVVTPASPNFQRLFEAVATIETDLQAVEMSEALVELTENYQKKDKRLFDLNYNITPDLRFRVLQDKDPRILRIGIETNCCQRIGGAGEDAAKQSFINPLAGVVILEWNHNEEWKILTQSYFHYVPKGNGFILDNVESNFKNVNASGVELEAAYAMLGRELKTKFDIGFFVAGKGYSKINTKSFTTSKLQGGDPRYFDPKAGKYSDFSASNNINLLSPNFDIDERASKLTGAKEKMTHAYVRVLGRIINTSLR